MMKKGLVIIITCISLIIGFVIGASVASRLWGRMTTRLELGQFSADAGTTAIILKKLRTGDTTNSLEVLEIRLDGDLIGLGSMLPDSDEWNRDPHYRETLQIAKDYRAQFPRKSGTAEIDAGVAKAFGLLEGQAVVPKSSP